MPTTGAATDAVMTFSTDEFNAGGNNSRPHDWYLSARFQSYVTQMPLDPRFLSILCCPVSKRPLRALSRSRLTFLNDAMKKQTVLDVSGNRLSTVLTDALISDDDKVIYRIDDGVPVLLPDEGIGTTQFMDFPA